jgi:hypothetical protein
MNVSFRQTYMLLRLQYVPTAESASPAPFLRAAVLLLLGALG